MTAATTRLTAADELAAAAVLYRYALTLDTRDWNGFGALFTEDCFSDYGRPFGTIEGPDQMISWAAHLHRGLTASLHRVTNVLVVQADDDTAELRADADVLFTREDRRFHGAGRFETQLRRRGDGWAIARHRFVGVWGEGDFRVLDHGWTPDVA